jgi:hypothetical protein
MPVFFCDPHHPWQRAENTIGCLRPAALRTSARSALNNPCVSSMSVVGAAGGLLGAGFVA